MGARPVKLLAARAHGKFIVVTAGVGWQPVNNLLFFYGLKQMITRQTAREWLHRI
jgi:hypothetical protein